MNKCWKVKLFAQFQTKEMPHHCSNAPREIHSWCGGSQRSGLTWLPTFALEVHAQHLGRVDVQELNRHWVWIRRYSKDILTRKDWQLTMSYSQNFLHMYLYLFLPVGNKSFHGPESLEWRPDWDRGQNILLLSLDLCRFPRMNTVAKVGAF